MIRTITFKSVLDGVLRRLGQDPSAENLPHDMVAAATEHINTRLETAWPYWPWKELEKTEERAFRPFWDGTYPYSNEEFYYPVTKTYYRAIAESAAGTVPTTVGSFIPIDIPLYGNIPFRQLGQEPIGQVFAVYTNGDPNVSGSGARKIDFMQTENGVDVGNARGLPTVWITYRIERPQFTHVPRVTGKSYAVGDVAYLPETGECYRASAVTGDPQVVTWALVPFPQLFANYVKVGAYADALIEMDDSGVDANLVQMRIAKASKAAAQAEEMIQALCRQQIEQGDRSTYKTPARAWRPTRWLCPA